MSSKMKITCKMCRREGVTLCGRDNCALKKRAYPPGVHGPKYARRKPRLSSYGLQLREKQKAKLFYNVLESQFRRYFEKASQKRGNTAEFLMQLLEERLDNVVYRLGFAKTRRQARQMISHGFFTVNDHLVNIPSYQVQIGDQIQIRDSKKTKALLKENEEMTKRHETPKWLSLDTKTMIGKVTSLPEGDDLRQVFDPTLIVEFYSR
ncbi:MAG: 30S ribosomal protein S4 [Candidatus Uhrbacteria bacterium GW2011_GWE2_40_58]|nr:MAG: 30S ribosomal protein S4 [Candidatus Uhrbacteria bacterium GW2011_GWF2_40_263]KKR68099.1 MAG: 30S ribosomal protein S4 [Candidatus Uhrbacteria bacterium GW2011_GWE2_40_58]OGL91800.1 MAG: 30S ribosomal protein S4 [Candidatus Uhrbacteria bacterium RIFOXYA2_FULL_40_9]OGL97250.1 MAG: 30S ribosomal protein S4 [Candidatus Uhrbacteria bacterium RIFOXYB2_FULL_41_18]HBK34443.1 30S ribosomal protein S4 [Candidatus Uhrbacteria bacterium]